MDNLTFANIVAFIILFLGLCCFVFFSITVYNIYRKSYRPQETTLILLSLITLFIVNSIFLILNISTVVEGITNSLETQTNQTVPNLKESLF